MGLFDFLPKVKSGDETIRIVDPEARGLTENLVIFVAFIGVVSIFVMEIGLVSPNQFAWVPLGVNLFLMAGNPFVRLEGFWEAIAIILMYANFMGFIIVFFRPQLTNAVIVSFTLLLVLAIFEYPRRFQVE